MLPVARTRDEARLYLDLTPCACGFVAVDWRHATRLVDGELASCYDTTCPGCDAVREYSFGLPPRESGGDYPNFGGAEPSQLLDAGRWLALADQLASRLPPDDPATRAEALSVAAAAVAEVIKFVPPGEEVVPVEAFWSAEGRRVYDAEPGRFRRGRLEVVLETYRAAAAR
ncbi:hypothetical protein [Kribbella sp. CA-247076]|uniref:hypothetical protein n=1 Tax=Kribbella sp. CA-247076 TaxID=3239941 RepID=UPI003D917A8B